MLHIRIERQQSKRSRSHSRRKTHEFTEGKMKATNAYSLTQFHLIVDAQDSPKISQKAFFH